MADIIQIKQDGVDKYPITKPECVIDENGNTIKDELAKKADWDAQEGEAGYIKNKPFRVIKSNNNEITNINSLFVITEDAFYPTCDLLIRYNNKTALLAKEKQELYYGDGAFAQIDDNPFYLGDDGESNIIVTGECEFDFELIIALSSEFIPDKWIKTIPQALTNVDKNQALANLGIDSMLKYLKNPLDLGVYKDTNIALPEDIASLIWTDGAILPNVLKFVVYTDESVTPVITLLPIGVMLLDNEIRFSSNSTTIDIHLVDEGDGIYVY